MNYLDTLARQIFAVVEPGQTLNGRNLSLFRNYALLALAKGGEADQKDMQSAWTVWKMSDSAFKQLPLNLPVTDSLPVSAVQSASALEIDQSPCFPAGSEEEQLTHDCHWLIEQAIRNGIDYGRVGLVMQSAWSTYEGEKSKCGNSSD